MEYEVATALVRQGFAVDADYSYSREDAGHQKDFSVDLRATAFPPYQRHRVLATVELLVECKHRHPGNKWLFFHDPNEPDMSPFTVGHTIRAVDSFSWQFFQKGSTVLFDEDATFCMKGVEVDTSTGNVHDAEIKHGLLQLQYALPRLLTDSIRFNALNGEEDNHPFFFCPILLTTAQLLLADETTSIKSVGAADSLEQIAKPVPWVVVASGSTPDFERHRERACSSLADLATNFKLLELDQVRGHRGEHDFFLPSRRCTELAKADRGGFHQYFSQTVVCSLEHFPSLVRSIKDITSAAVRSRRRFAKQKDKQS